jgi:para-nitrobenzyl esterase
MKMMAVLFGGLSLLASPAGAKDEAGVPVQVRIETGVIEGLQDDASGIQAFLGIPYAKPPVGPLRWKAPQRAEGWSGVLETKKFGPRAVQTNVWGDMNYRSNGMSEDCLYLNVWAPVRKAPEGLPVLVYIYGGGFVAGDGSEPRYDGASMAEKGIISLTVNYRLNVFGFLSHPELSAESPYSASGNYGLLDQVAALEWVQRNIRAFGGDPGRVTVAGESAGSISVSSLMASPLSRNLMAGAIGESGAAIHPTMAPVSREDAEKTGLEFARNAGVPGLAGLRALDTDAVFKAYVDSKRFGFPTVVDGYFYPKTLPEIFTGREQAQIPLLAGWNSAEIPGLAFIQGPVYSDDAYVTKVKEAFPDDFETVLKLYPHGSPGELERSATALASDRFIAYATWKWLDLQAKNSPGPVYRYLYAKLRPPAANAGTGTGPAAIGAPHACEIEYAMGNLVLVKDYAWTPDDFRVSETMQNYFANFIRTGNPNGNSLPKWPAVSAADPSPAVMVIDAESNAARAVDDGRYRFLDVHYGNAR